MVKAHFEPKGRLLMSIGRDLIKDSSAALVELVKIRTMQMLVRLKLST